MADRRSEILEITCRLIAESGIRHVTFEKIAADLGAPTIIGSYFPDMPALIAAAFDWADSRATAHVGEQITTTDPLERLEQMLNLFIDDAPALREDWIFWMEMEASALFDPAMLSIVTEHEGRWVDMIAGLIRLAAKERMITGTEGLPVDPEGAALRLVLIQDALARQTTLGWMPVAEARRVMTEAFRREVEVSTWH